MKNEEKKKEQLIDELLEVRRRIAELEALEAEHKQVEQETREYAESIVDTVREGLVVLDANLRVISANRSFYETFKVKPGETEGQRLYDLGNRQWDILKLRELLEEILPRDTTFDNYEVEHKFEIIGRRVMHLNARQIYREIGETHLILLAIEDVTERKSAEEALRKSGEELRLLSSQLLTAQETERGRIARELHDGVGQSLGAIKFRVEDALGQLAKGSTESSVSTLGNLIPVIQSTVQEVRRITMGLRPSTLDDLGILATIAWLCREFQATYSTVEIKREISVEESDVPNSLKIALYRVLQEVLNNVAKHSGANMVTISLAKKDNTIQLAIEDNGCGFDVEEARSVESSERGFGLGSMKERTELSGGTFVINSAEGRGTFVRASWPYNEFHRNRQN
jgi:PAS domain S-box-containing protein